MATKFTYPHPSGGGDMVEEVDDGLGVVTEAVNVALQTKEKFVVFALAGGGKRAFIAADISAIWEE